ncbi:hypothetical protein [Streptomyces sp. NPDC058623]
MGPLIIGLIGAGVGVSGQVILWRGHRHDQEAPVTPDPTRQ